MTIDTLRNSGAGISGVLKNTLVFDKIKECFASAVRDEKNERKHKGLLFIKSNREEAEEYIRKAKRNLELCHFYKEQGFEYKIPEEWFYTLYYCALAIL